jgi:hypothetical protein
MIHARNAVVVQSLRRLLHGECDTDTPTRIGVMYGALHFDDLLQQVLSLLALWYKSTNTDAERQQLRSSDMQLEFAERGVGVTVGEQEREGGGSHCGGGGAGGGAGSEWEREGAVSRFVGEGGGAASEWNVAWSMRNEGYKRRISVVGAAAVAEGFELNLSAFSAN